MSSTFLRYIYLSPFSLHNPLIHSPTLYLRVPPSFLYEHYQPPLQAFVWGSSGLNLEEGKREITGTPTPQTSYIEFPFARFFPGLAYNLFLSHDRSRLFGWGRVNYGLKPKENEYQVSWKYPKELRNLSLYLDDEPILRVACGSYHTLIQTYSGGVYSFGSGQRGALGLSDDQLKTANVHKRESLLLPYPKKIQSFSSSPSFSFSPSSSTARSSSFSSARSAFVSPLKHLGASEDFSLCITNNDEIWTWGANDQFQLGLGSSSESVNQPTMLPTPFLSKSDPNQRQNPNAICAVASGWGHTIIATGKGEVYSWGSNRHGQCGTGNCEPVKTPTKILELGEPVVSIACSASHSALITLSGRFLIWGSRADCKLGIPDQREDILTPTDLEVVPREIQTRKPFRLRRPTKVVCGSDHTLVLTADGKVYGWGFGQHGCLGQPVLENRDKPTKLEFLNPYFVRHIFASIDHSVAIV